MSQEIVVETMVSIRDYVPKLTRASGEIADRIQDNEGGWVHILLDYFEGMTWLVLAINGIRNLNQELLEGWDINLLARLIDQVKEAMEQEDMVTLCDLMRYELQPLLKSYEDMLLDH